ncbi:MAG: type I-D CRISPR-associated protein Cas10d/Csc3 [Caldilineaceae bacterium]|nr:type I-D CRISPR-associated protein Cas10d/Csc3 [Caldilineaceae bacterium]
MSVSMQQLSFMQSDYVEDEALDPNLLGGSEDDESDSETGETSLAPEPIFSALLRTAARKLWGDDPVIDDFVTHVAPHLSDLLGHVTAKGGIFAEEMRAAGARDVERYGDDQSMRSHLINGLFPVLHIAHTLQSWRAPQFRYYDDTVRRLFIAGDVLHDWLKLPGVEAELEAAGVRHDTVNAAQHRAVVEQIFRVWGGRLRLDDFLAPIGGLDYRLHDLIFIACNTQVKWGTLRNLAALPQLTLPGPQLDLTEQLSRLADYLAYIARNPRIVASDKYIHSVLSGLSNQNAHLVYHHVADVRGVITNLIHNAALESRRNDDCVPLLYAPTGIVYLARKEAQFIPDLDTVAEAVVQKVRKVGGFRLSNSLTGFGRDGKGLKYAAYYSLFFETLDMLDVAVAAAAKIIHEGKKPSAGKRYAKLATDGWMDGDVDLVLPDDFRVDQMAEWCYQAEKIARDAPGGGSAARFLIDAMGLGDIYEDFLSVPRDARAGGVGYHWYFAAGHYLKRTTGLDPAAWQERIQDFSRQLKAYLLDQQKKSDTPAEADDGFGDLRKYVKQILHFGPITQPAATDGDGTSLFATELDRYANAKKRGRGTTAMCALCSSPYTVNKQEEAAALFAPQVYSNKMALHGSSAIRDICSICGLEMMLRQILMNRSNASGGRFEGRRLRYLYFYPTYFFTPETLEIFRILHTRLRRISFTELRRQLVTETEGTSEVRLDPAIWQRLEPLLMTPEAEFSEEEDRYLRMHFPENEPVTFYFMGVPPPGRDAKDAESWVHPAFLSLLLPLCVDVKVVASESQMPVLAEADELAETVFLDGAHAAIGYIVGRERINLDRVLPALQRLTTSYLIHMDGNSEPGGKDFYRWQQFPALARHLSESPLYAFWYLKKWQRKAKADAIPAEKASQYLRYIHFLAEGGNLTMTHASTLTELYRQFYRAKPRPNSNSILRPVTIAAKTLMEADRRLFSDVDSLIQLVTGELDRFILRVSENKADGRLPKGIDKPTRDQAIRSFADYFVRDLFFDILRSDISALRGKQLNLLKSACEVVYRDLDAQYWVERGAADEAIEPESEEDREA